MDYINLDSRIRGLHILSNCLNSGLVTLDISRFPSLKTLQIDSNSCRSVEVLLVQDEEKLQTIKVGEDSFTQCDREKNTPDSKENESIIKQMKKKMVVKNNSVLTSIVIEKGAFSDYSRLFLKSGRNRAFLWNRPSFAQRTADRRSQRRRVGQGGYVVLLLRQAADALLAPLSRDRHHRQSCLQPLLRHHQFCL